MRTLPTLTLAAVMAGLAVPAAAELTRGLALPGFAPAAPTVSGTLRPGWRTEAGHRMAGIDLRLTPGWKTYWRSPGEAGIPPAFDWSGSENLRAVRIHWPKPQVFTLNGMQTLGYHDGVVLPVEVVPVDPGRPVVLRVAIEMGICRDICLPADLRLEAALPPGQSGPDSAIRAALADRPATPREAGLTGLNCRVEPVRDGLRVTASMDLPPQGRGPEAVVIEPAGGNLWASEARVRRDGRQLTAVADLIEVTGAPFALDRSGLTVTVVGPKGAVEQRGCPAP